MLLVEANVVVQVELNKVKSSFNRHTLVPVVMNSASDVDGRVFQLKLVSRTSKMHVTGHPVYVIVLVPEESSGLIMSGVVDEDGTLYV